jgi:hypothetical protein
MYTGPHIIKDGLVFGYDTGYGIADNNISTRLYPGEPTTNLKSSNQTSGQIAGMSGVSLTYVGEENGYSKYSMSGTFSGGTYPYCMYLPGVSFSGNTAYSTQVKLKTSAAHKFNYFGGGINYVNQAMNSSGTNSSVLQSDGFNYIKREGFNYVSTTAQSGYIHSNPINNTTFNSSTDFIYVKHFQIEQNTHCTPWTATSRSNTDSLIDLKGTTDIDVSNVSFDSTGQPDFDGTDDYFTTSGLTTNSPTSVSFETIIKFDGTLDSSDRKVFHWDKTNTSDGVAQIRKGNNNGRLMYQHHNGTSWYTLSVDSVVTSDTYIHILLVHSGTTATMYKNGVQVGTTTVSNLEYTNAGEILIGYRTSSEYWKGEIPIFKVYNKALTATEVKQNYNAYKNRFDI